MTPYCESQFVPVDRACDLPAALIAKEQSAHLWRPRTGPSQKRAMGLSQPYRSTSVFPIEARWSRTPGGPVTSSHSTSPASSPASAYSL